MHRSLLLALSSLALILTQLPALSQPQGKGPLWESLDLSPAQQEQLEQLRQERQAQFMEILTEDQQQQLEDLRQTGAVGSGVRRQLNLTEDQKQALRQVHDSSKVELESILTPEQQQQLTRAREKRQRRSGLLETDPDSIEVDQLGQ